MKKGTPAFTLWFTGLPCSGKTTLASATAAKLWAEGCTVAVLDGDRLRKTLSPDLGFSKDDRQAHARRVAGLAALFNAQNVPTLVSLISPYRSMREEARKSIPSFFEVYVRCPLNICEKRDVKGMYRLARQGKIKNFTGVSDVYEEPVSPDLVVDTDRLSVEMSVKKIMDFLFCPEFLEPEAIGSQRT